MSYLGTNVLMFGGYNDIYLNSLYTYDLEESHNRPKDASTPSWQALMPNESHSNRPLAIMDHTMIPWDNKLYFYVL